jgi:alkenylglycerophosphocholine/alkenylglycerophosphoethanolamine hydrolase
MLNHLPWYVILLAVVNWVAVECKWKRVEYSAKPGTMVLLLIWVGLNAEINGVLFWFILGIVLSLGGDIFLMLPGNFFIPGLISFLFAHVAYIIGLNIDGLIINLHSAVYFTGIAVISFWLYERLALAMTVKGQQALRLPVLIYVLVISIMVYSALMTGWRDGWIGFPAVLVSIGGVLFMTSDGMLAWDMFVRPRSHAPLRVMVTYHLGQLGIITGAVLMVLNR